MNTTARDISGGFAEIIKSRWFNVTDSAVINSQSVQGRIINVESETYLANVSISKSIMQCNSMFKSHNDIIK